MKSWSLPLSLIILITVARFNNVSLDLILKIYSFQSSKSAISNLEKIISKFDKKEVYKI